MQSLDSMLCCNNSLVSVFASSPCPLYAFPTRGSRGVEIWRYSSPCLWTQTPNPVLRMMAVKVVRYLSADNTVDTLLTELCCHIYKYTWVVRMREWCFLEVRVSMELVHKNWYYAVSYIILKDWKAHGDITVDHHIVIQRDIKQHPEGGTHFMEHSVPLTD
jgi:hypothetical protein